MYNYSDQWCMYDLWEPIHGSLMHAVVAFMCMAAIYVVVVS
jgi:hypothetical protein